MTLSLCHRLILLSLVLFSLTACQSSSGPTFDSTGYEIDPSKQNEITWAIKRNESGKILEKGMLLNGVKHGSWMYYDPTKNGVPELIQNYINGELYGSSVAIDKNGRAFEINNYADSLLHGDQIKLKSGIVGESTPYELGVRHGIFRSYFANGSIQQEVPYRDGSIHGQLKYFNAKGEVTVEYTYENGEKLSGGITE